MNLRLLHNKTLSLLITGKVISLVGTAMQDFAFSLYVLKITGSGKLFASVLAIALIPKLLLGPIGGVFVDWLDRKKILVYLDLLSGILIGTIYIISTTIGIQLIHIYTAVILLSLISVMFNPAVSSIIPSIMKKEDLADANSINALTTNIGYLLAPALGGFLYGTYGLAPVLLINSLSFIIAAIAEMFLDIPKTQKQAGGFTFHRFQQDFLQGIQFIKNKKALIRIMICAFVLNSVVNPIFSVGITYISKINLKITDLQYGILETAIVVGTLIGPIFSGSIFKKAATGKVYFTGFILMGVLVGIIGVIAAPVYIDLFQSNRVPYFTFIGVSVIFAAIVVIVSIAMTTVMQKEIPLELMGRVTSVWSTGVMAAIPLGQIVFGVLFDRMPSYIPILLGAGVVLGTALLFGYVGEEQDFKLL